MEMKQFRIIVLSGVLFTLISCDSINKIIGTPPNTTVKASKQDSGSNRAMRHFFSKKKNKGNDSEKTITEVVVSEEKSQPVSAQNENSTVDLRPVSVKETGDVVNKSMVDHIDGEWKFDNVYGRPVMGEDDRPYIIFEAGNSPRFYAFDGCNYMSGRYTVVEKNVMQLSDVLTTSNICVDNPQSSEIRAVIAQGKYFELTTLRSEEFLEILNVKRQRIGTLHRHCITALNGMWEVAAIGDMKVSDKNPPTIVIDLLEKKIHGNSGCSLFNGTIYQDPDKDVSVQFQGMNVSKHNCAEIATETALLVALERVEMAFLDGDTKAVLCDANGNHLITLVRTE